MITIPIDIPGNENIVRGICSHYHIKNGKLLHRAFAPPVGTDEVSVYRSDYIGADKCKQRTKKDAQNLNIKPQKIYLGLAVLSAKEIRNAGAAVVDSRVQFLGHADIKHGFKIVKNEPDTPENTYRMKERNEKLANLANYHTDPNPTNDTWQGANLYYQLPANIQ